MTTHNDVFGARTTLQGASDSIIYYQLDALTKRGITGLERLPFTVKIILENLLRHAGGELVTEDDVLSLARWTPGQASQSESEYPFMPSDQLLTEGHSTFDRAKRKPMYDEVQKIVATDLPYLSLYMQSNVAVMRKGISGYVQYPAGFYLSVPQMTMK